MRKAGAYETLWESSRCWRQPLAELWGSGAGTLWVALGPWGSVLGCGRGAEPCFSSHFKPPQGPYRESRPVFWVGAYADVLTRQAGAREEGRVQTRPACGEATSNTGTLGNG